MEANLLCIEIDLIRFQMNRILICLLLFSLSTSAQELKDFRPPAGYQLVKELSGDLDKDGISEVAFVYNTTKLSADYGYDRVLYICKKIGVKLKLWKENRSVLWRSKDCGFFADEGVPLDILIKNNTLIITQTFNHNTRRQSSYKDIFRYQKGDWYLIGATHHFYDNCEYNYDYDINFSTKKVDITKEFDSCDENAEVPEDDAYSFTYAFKAIPKMDGFIPGKTEVKMTNPKMNFYY